MNADEANHLRGLLDIHHKRLHKLEERAAKYGIDCPPEVQIEIDEIKEQIERFDKQLSRRLIASYPQGKIALGQFKYYLDGIEQSLANVTVKEERVYRF